MTALAVLTVHPGGKRFAASPARSILNVLLAEGYPIDTACGGRAKCGRCLIRIGSGASMLSPRTPAEEVRLAALDAGPDARLACQSYARGEVALEVVNLRGRVDGGPGPGA